jgi:predicted nucleic-acid-binding protein
VIAVDTNILLRLTIKDDPAQMERAVALMDKALADRQAVLVNAIVLAEYIWTMARTYRANRQEQAAAVRELIDRPPYRLFDESIVKRALETFESSKADFADCLIGEINQAQAAKVTYGFDEAAALLDAFALPPKP